MTKWIVRGLAAAGFAAVTWAGGAAAAEITVEAFPVPPGSRPHDVAPAVDGRVWYTGQNKGVMGLLDPKSGEVVEIPLGPGSRPHGVIVDAHGDAWITDGGQNAIVRFDPGSEEFQSFPSPRGRAQVRQLLGRSGEVWAPESATDTLVVVRTAR